MAIHWDCPSEPFYSLNTRDAWEFQYLDDERKEFIYDRGKIVDEFQIEQSYQRTTYGWSIGLENGWARHFTVGVVRDVNTFSQLDGSSVSSLIPDDRDFQYPLIGYERIEDRFELARNRDQMGRTEDFYFGTGFSASLGLLSKSLDSDRDGLILQSGWNYSLSSGEKTRWLLVGNLSGRWESAQGLENALIGARLRYYYRQSPKRLRGYPRCVTRQETNKRLDGRATILHIVVPVPALLCRCRCIFRRSAHLGR